VKLIFSGSLGERQLGKRRIQIQDTALTELHHGIREHGLAHGLRREHGRVVHRGVRRGVLHSQCLVHAILASLMIAMEKPGTCNSDRSWGIRFSISAIESSHREPGFGSTEACLPDEHPSSGKRGKLKNSLRLVDFMAGRGEF
jgi:hypothetical protein